LLIYDLSRGDVQAAMARYQARYPQMLVEDPEVGESYPVAIDVAMLFRAMGQPGRANRLLDRSLEYLDTRDAHEVGDYGVFLARVHALRGDTDAAIEALRKAVDAGWRLHWWFYLKQDPAFDSVRDSARFQAIVSELDAWAVAQLAEVRALEVSGAIALP
jgi:tetratricopeptide (TPR) repeat protein